MQPRLSLLCSPMRQVPKYLDLAQIACYLYRITFCQPNSRSTNTCSLSGYGLYIRLTYSSLVFSNLGADLAHLQSLKRTVGPVASLIV